MLPISLFKKRKKSEEWGRVREQREWWNEENSNELFQYLIDAFVQLINVWKTEGQINYLINCRKRWGGKLNGDKLTRREDKGDAVNQIERKKWILLQTKNNNN